MKIALVGAGHIGHTIAQLLSATGNFGVTVIDSNSEALDKLKGIDNIQTKRIAGPDYEERLKAMQTCDAVINALPHYMNLQIAREAFRSGCHYFDLSEDVADAEGIMNLANGAKTAFMPQCGLAPGFIGIVGHHLSQQFDELHDVKMRVGALPQFPTNALKYNLTWSIDGLINEYCNPCKAVVNGYKIDVQPLEGLEHFSIDGVEYEAFNTSGGLGTLCDTLRDEVVDMNYKTIRYPGHRDIMRLLLNDLKLSQDKNNLKDILKHAIPVTMQDLVIVFVTATGIRNGQLVQETFSKKIFATQQSTAIQLTTAAGICAAVDLFREGKLPHNGFIKQEDISLPVFLANRFGSVYQ